MKKTIKVLVPIILTIVILASCCWYLFSYDQAFTRDMLVSVARFCENQGSHTIATWFYDAAYAQIGDNDSVAIEHAEQYKKIGNYTKAEYTLRNAISDGGGAPLYVALAKIFVEQDKLLDAVNMLNNITDPAIKQQIDEMRPEAPTSSHVSGKYNQYITVSFSSTGGTMYVAADGEYPSVNADQYTGPIDLGEGENNMYAVNVSENGLVSTLSVYSYTIGGIIRPVTFADAAVEAAVREQLLVESPTILHTNDLWKIKEFSVPADAKDYSDIGLMIYLEKLTIDNAAANQMVHFSTLTELTELTVTKAAITSDELKTIASLPKLNTLTLSDCGLASIAPLSASKALVYLDLSNNAIRNLEPLSTMDSLSELILAHNAVEDLSPLATSKALTKLDVSYNALTEIDRIAGVSTLTWINAEHNIIAEIGQLDTLTNLTYLSLNANKLTSVSTLTDCAELTELYIAQNELTEIGALNKLVKLMYLDFSNNKVTTIPSWPKTCALVTINGSSNKIKSITPLSGLTSLNVVSMDYNESLSSVKDLASCPLLTQVNVYGTKVKEVSDLTKQSVIVNYNPV